MNRFEGPWTRVVGGVVVLLSSLVGAGCGSGQDGDVFNSGHTAADREALFDTIMARTERREAFSPEKNRRLGNDPLAAMEAYREEVVGAESDQALYYALLKTSNARKDRHLRVRPVEGGIATPSPAAIGLENYPDPESAVPHAPVKFAVDHSTPGGYFLFVADVAGIAEGAGVAEVPGGRDAVAPGQKVVRVNGMPAAEYFALVEPYHRYSTTNGFWNKLALWLPQKGLQFPPEAYRPTLDLVLENPDGSSVLASLPYVGPEDLRWRGIGEPAYPGFEMALERPTFNFHLPTEGQDAVVIQWFGFREFMIRDTDELMVYAAENGLLDHAVIFDATRSGGGSNGAYAIQRIQPRPFKTTFGNMRISDVTVPFMEARIARGIDPDHPEALRGIIDDGTWLLDWFEHDVVPAVERGDAYTNNVPFKNAHAPRDSDGVILPADVHFRGPLVVLLGPFGGSHLDQFVSIVVDNELGHVIGMQAGGYSNTWEWEEVLTFPDGSPVVEFMWDIGHTITPGGRILEGAPSEIDDDVPVTRDNFADYYSILTERALAYLARPSG
jgi:hypothetical protein